MRLQTARRLAKVKGVVESGVYKAHHSRELVGAGGLGGDLAVTDRASVSGEGRCDG